MVIFAYCIYVLHLCIKCEEVPYFSMFLINETAIKRNFLSWFFSATPAPKQSGLKDLSYVPVFFFFKYLPHLS